MNSSVAVMQPYFFPYIGYFQLINAVDTLVIYDDVSFIKKGWINRNQILINGENKYITIPLKNASQNKLIKDIKVSLTGKDSLKLLKKIQFSYSNAPFFENTFPLIENVIMSGESSISELAFLSIQSVCSYLRITTSFKKSSAAYQNRELARADRLMDITKSEGAQNYINPTGGIELYKKEDFEKEGVQLHFLESKKIVYTQFGDPFVPWLSIIDVMMFNSPERIQEMLQKYRLI